MNTKRLTGFGFILTAVILGAAGCAKMPSELQPASMTPLPGSGPYFDGRAGRPQSMSALRKSKLALASAGLSRSDEVWVLAQGTARTAEQAADTPGTGALLAIVDEKKVPMPLKHTDVRARISGYVGTVDVTQQFHNPYSSKIEAVYVFPLPHNAAVNEFVMTIGERRIRGIIRERKEAEAIYQDAKRQGYVASLLTEERPNVFTQSVANIEPGKEIDVSLHYYHTLEYADGWYEFVFPMVVGPRFNPPGSTQGIGAVARGATGLSGQATEVQYLKPGETTAHQVSLAVEIDAGVSIEEHECKTHRVSFEAPTPEKLLVKIDDSDKLPNRDFVLRYRVAGERVKTDFLAFRDQRGGYFTAMVYPPKEMTSLRRQPLELVFVLDCSGSMNGRPIAQSKAAVDRALDLLQPGDSFQLISFSMSASQFGSRPVEATDENVDRARAYLAGLKGEGGTMMIEGIKAALDFPHDPQRLRFVCFLTDGFIGNEAEILGEIRARLGAARIFSFGIGSSVNRFLIDEMAVAGRGAVAYLGLRDSAPRIMESFFERISHPALIDLSIDWGGLQVTEVYPRQLPDLFVGRPVILTGRLQGEWDGTIRVRGQAAGQRLEIPISAVTHENHPEAAALPSVWARMKIADLANRSTIEDVPNVAETVKQLALDYSLLSAYTAFVAVDSSRRTEGSEGTTVPVAVPVPEGVKYDTTVTEK